MKLLTYLNNRYVAICAVLFSLGALATNCNGITVLYAQTLPATVHVVWTPSAVDSSHSAPVQYSVVTDSGTPVIVQASACTTNLCSTAITVNSFGGHSTVVSAQNFQIDSDPATLQSVSAAAVVWVLNQGPNSPANVKLTK